MTSRAARQFAAAAAAVLLALQPLAAAAEAARPAAKSAYQFDGPESRGVSEVTRIALTGRSVDGLPTATQSPSATRPLHGGIVTNSSSTAKPAGESSGGTPVLPESAALLLAGVLAVFGLMRRRRR